MTTIESTSTPSIVPRTRKAPAKKSASASTPAATPPRASKPAAKRVVTPRKLASTHVASVSANVGVTAAKPAPVGQRAPTPVQTPNTVVADAKTVKEKKQKLVRDSVTIPKAEYLALDTMKRRAAQLQVLVKKTELIRAGIKCLSSLPDTAFLAAIAAVPNLKTGRPAKE